MDMQLHQFRMQYQAMDQECELQEMLDLSILQAIRQAIIITLTDLIPDTVTFFA